MSSEWNPSPRHVSASKLSEVHAALGKYIYVTETKMAGGVHAVDMATCRALAWIAYWNYGDTCPITHHISAFPSSDPYAGFEFVNTTQGGKNLSCRGERVAKYNPGRSITV
jgi:thiocyanate desulfurase